jgi:hypothetical protein
MKDLQSRLFTSGILLLLTLIAVSGCFITNCPPGGKRSGASPNTRQVNHDGKLRQNRRKISELEIRNQLRFDILKWILISKKCSCLV